MEELTSDIHFACLGDVLSFSVLKHRHISSIELFAWNAPIDVINNYQLFLETNEQNLASSSYCNCSQGKTFGKYCELEYALENSPMLGGQDNSCFVGLSSQCDYSCLDWRQVCNLIADCTSGVDEPEECWTQRARNICHNSTEFQCENGMCIDRQFAFDQWPDCLDGSDELYTIDEERMCEDGESIHTISCDERMCSYRASSPCGNDGQCLVDASIGCLQSHIYSHEMNTHLDDMCYGYFLCSLRFSDAIKRQEFFSKFRLTLDDCFCADAPDKECIKELSNSCEDDWIFFPSNAISSPDVRLLYRLDDNTIYGKEFFAPPFVCFNVSTCTSVTVPFRPIQINRKNYTCTVVTQFTPYYTNVFNAQSSPNKLDYDIFLRVLKREISKVCFTSDPSGPELKPAYPLKASNIKPCIIDIKGRIKNDECMSEVTLKVGCIEIPVGICQEHDDLACRCLRSEEIPSSYVLFQEICNNIMFPDFNHSLLGDTDETDCFQWQQACLSKYAKCNGAWECLNGMDETECQGQRCPGMQHFCIDPRHNKQICVPQTVFNNGEVNCSGSIDERAFTSCPGQFKCARYGNCVSVFNLCDGENNCISIDEDDEAMCPWRKEARKYCPINTFACSSEQENFYQCLAMEKRCDGHRDCSEYGEDEWLCSLVPKRLYRSFDVDNGFDHFSRIHNDIRVPQNSKINLLPAPIDMSQESLLNANDLRNPTKAQYPQFSDQTSNPCRRGILLLAFDFFLNKTRHRCMCPPMHYGNYCQFQSSRATLVVQVDTPIRSNALRIVVSSLVPILRPVENVIHLPSIHSLPFRHVIYLDHQSGPIQVDVFDLQNSIISHLGAWYLRNRFSYLPVNRFTLRISTNSGRFFDLLYCTGNENLTCVHGRCRLYMNQNVTYHCYCDVGWSGKQCDQSSPFTFCSKNSIAFAGRCICPLGAFGSTCHFKFDPCAKNLCHRGSTCVPLDPRLSIPYACVCPTETYGNHCEQRAAHITVRLNDQGRNHRQMANIPIVLAHFFDVHHGSIGFAHVRDRVLLTNMLFGSQVIIPYERHFHLSTFVFIQTLIDGASSFHWVALLKYPVHSLNTQLLSSNECPSIHRLLNSTILTWPYLKRVKFYHRACLVLLATDVHCFVDEFYLCLCDKQARLDCLPFNHSAYNCSSDGFCQNNAQCARPIERYYLRPPGTFACACRACFYGNLCQFTIVDYSISLDALIGAEVIPKLPVFRQSSLLKITLAFSVFFLISGTIANTLAVATMLQKTTRDTGCGYYLLTLVCAGQTGLFAFAVKFFTLFNSAITINCAIMETFLSTAPVLVDWLIACIAVDRVVTVVKGVQYDKSQSRNTAKWVIIILIFLVLISMLHRPLSQQILNDPHRSSSWCMLKFNTHWLATYNLTITIFHLVTPFIINFFSIIIVIYSLTRRKTQILLQHHLTSQRSVLRNHLSRYTHLIVGPLILFSLELPRLLITFALVCFHHSWQKYVYMASYFVSVIPLGLSFFIFIIPSPTYRAATKTMLSRVRAQKTSS